MSSFRRHRQRCALAAVLVLSAVSPTAAASIFTLADDSTTVVRGVVDRTQSYEQDKFLVFSITPREVLKGTTATVGSPIQLVQERVFGSELPYFKVGDEALVFAVALPPYSYYRRALPDGAYLRWTEPKDSAADVAALEDTAVTAAVARYLAAKSDPAAIARDLAALLASPVPRLRADALDAIVTRKDLAAALDAAALAPVRAALDDERLPLAERGAILLGLARAGAPGAAALAEHAVTAGGPLLPVGADALVTLGRAPREEQLLAWSRSSDPALRIAAVRGLANASSRAAFDRLTQVVTTDADPTVRIAAVKALGSAHDARAVLVLAQAMRSTDKGEILAASDALGRLATPEAVRALGTALRDGSFDAETAAAFALKQAHKHEADVILQEQRDLHPDPEVRRVIRLALGEHVGEHDD